MTKATLLPLLAGCLLLSACSQWNYTFSAPSPTISDSSVGKLNRSEVMALLGPPDNLSKSGDGYVFAWEYIGLTETSVGFTLGPLGLEFLSLDWSHVSSHGEYLLATFDANHTLTALSLSKWNSNAGDSKSIQPLGVVNGISSSDLRARSPQHRWGKALLQRLPEALNAHSDIDSGEFGLEQRATPTSPGQRTLELH
jgi:hypothetical protein